MCSLNPILIPYNSARDNPNTSANPQYLALLPLLPGTLPPPGSDIRSNWKSLHCHSQRFRRLNGKPKDVLVGFCDHHCQRRGARSRGARRDPTRVPVPGYPGTGTRVPGYPYPAPGYPCTGMHDRRLTPPFHAENCDVFSVFLDFFIRGRS